DFHVTGDQTCALPIYEWTSDFHHEKRGTRPDGDFRFARSGQYFKRLLFIGDGRLYEVANDDNDPLLEHRYGRGNDRHWVDRIVAQLRLCDFDRYENSRGGT